MGAAGSEALEQLNALRAELSGFGSSTLGALDRAIEAISDASVPSCCIGAVESSAAPEMSLSGEPIPLLTTLTFERRPPGLTAPETVGDPPYDLVFQDQKGMCVTYRELLAGRPSVLTFFYTRCDNPNKCSRTITMFGRLVTAAYEAGLDDRFNALAVTYDPAFDTPSRMAAYGESRGVVYSDRVRMARTPVDFDRLSTYLQLGVSFGPSIVNRHRIEVYLLDAKGRVVGTIARRQWDVADVLPQLVELVRTAA
jgi:protein SCO1/2